MRTRTADARLAAHRLVQLLASTGLCVLVASGCASHAQTAPVYRQTTPAGSTEVTVREQFDPARFREDLLLIQPVFTPPSVVTPPSDPGAIDTSSVSVSTLPSGALPSGADVAPTTSAVDITVFRVQVIALSQEDGARRIADELGRRFAIPANVTPQGRLFAVHAGEARTAEDAEELRAQIAALSKGYEGAFLVSDTLRVIDQDIPVAVVAPPTEGDLAVADMSGASTPDAVVVAEAETPLPEPELVLVQGWRVLIGQFMNLADAQDYRRQVMKRLKRDDVDVKFEAPWYKVLAGSFRTSTAAQQFVERCRSLGFRTAALVRGDVYLPREGENNR